VLEAYGLKTHIWNNNLKSTFLLIAFPLLLLILAYGLILLFFGFTSEGNIEQGLQQAARAIPTAVPITR